jgi:acetyl-CoA carboxylase biotin carboxyl carrier protein
MSAIVLENVRALLAAFARSPWRDLHLRTELAEVFIAKTNGGANPMVAQQADQHNVKTVRAPHIASMLSVLPNGTKIAAGDVVATIELLGAPIEIVSADAGTILSAEGFPGGLVEYDQPLVTLAA